MKKPNLGPGFYAQIDSSIKPLKYPKLNWGHRICRKHKKHRKKIDMLIEQAVRNLAKRIEKDSIGKTKELSIDFWKHAFGTEVIDIWKDHEKYYYKIKMPPTTNFTANIHFNYSGS